MRVGIIGGGFMGMVLARHLATSGHSVTVLEKDRQLGGLATHHDYGAFSWDRFYHCILPSDTHLIRLLTDIGLGDKLRWARTLTGLYVDEKFHSLSSSLDFLRFPPLSLLEKARLAWTIHRASRIADWRELEKVPVTEWLIQRCGRRTYEKLWKPLLLAKLGESYRQVSAVFIRAYIQRMYSARASSARKEHLGYVSGGYKGVFTRLEEIVQAAGGDIRTGAAVRRVRAGAGRGLWIEHGEDRQRFDKVIFTGPVNLLEKVADGGLAVVSKGQRSVDYMGVVCLVLVTRRPVVPYYIVNIADGRLPFTGIIGMSTLVSTEELAGFHLTYLPRYVPSSDPLLKCSDEEIRTRFLDGLRAMLPAFDLAGIEAAAVNRAAVVQPLQVLDYSRLVPKVVTSHPDFYVLNTSQFVDCTVNNNEVVRAVSEFMAQRGAEFRRRGNLAECGLRRQTARR